MSIDLQIEFIYYNKKPCVIKAGKKKLFSYNPVRPECFCVAKMYRRIKNYLYFIFLRTPFDTPLRGTQGERSRGIEIYVNTKKPRNLNTGIQKILYI